MTVFVAAQDIPRLTRFFFTDKTVPAKTTPPLPSKKWMRITKLVLKTVLIIWALGMNTRKGLKNKKIYEDLIKSPLYGIYEVESFERNTKQIPPLATDSTRWDLLIVFQRDYAAVRTMTGETGYYRFSIDTASKSIKWENSTTLIYDDNGNNILTIRGRIIHDSVNIRLRKKDLREFTLVNRGFHWISEYPFNR